MEMGPIRYAENDGVSIAYATIGEGPTELIFVPGFVSHLEIMGELPQAQRFFERLASLRPGDLLRQARHGALRPRRRRLHDRGGQPRT